MLFMHTLLSGVSSCFHVRIWKDGKVMLPLLPIFLGSILTFLSTVTINVFHLASVFMPLAIADEVIYKDTLAL